MRASTRVCVGGGGVSNECYHEQTLPVVLKWCDGIYRCTENIL